MDLNTDTLDHDILIGDGTAENCPQDIRASGAVFDLRFHPSQLFLALGMVNGGIEVHGVDSQKKNQTKLAANLPEVHSGGVTGLEFSEDGQHLISVSSDKSISVMDCSTQQQLVKIKKSKTHPHKHGISMVNVCSESVVATGDDDGTVVFWDLRAAKREVMKYHEHGDYITGMLFFDQVQQLVTSSGDTCVGCFDFRKSRVVDFSDKRKEDLYCLAFIPATNDLICGTPSGELPVWRYGSWARPYDVFPKHPKECEAIEVYNDNIVLTGAQDSMIRVIQIYPTKRVLAHLGGHQKKFGGGVSRIRISADRSLAASSGQDQIVRFVDLAFLGDEKEVDRLLNKAEARHMQTIREANEDDEEKEEGDDEDTESDSDDSDWTTDGDDDEEASEEEDSDSDDDAPVAKTDRQKKRERVAAAQWLKEAQKEKINFRKEGSKRRVKGFWGDLVE